MKYDPLIIDVEEIDLQNTAKMIGVSTIDDLAKLAEKHNVMILHAGQNNVDKYVVHVDGNSYAYAQVRQQTDIIHNSTGIYRAEFDRGIDRGEFEVHYQPIISLTDGRITAVEALLRWQHPQRGMLSAGEFIQTAEVTGFIGKLDEWALQVACTQLKEWRDAGYDLKLAVNLSDYLLARDPAELFQSVLRKTQAEASWLQIEIPEGKMAHPNPTVLLKIQQLKEMGLHITIDDFVGEVGLSSISQMQVSSVKIDRLLVKKMGDPVEAITVQRMIAVATTLGMNVVGKGVETDEEKVFLANSGSQAQGFLLGHPVPAYEIGKILQQNVSPVSSKTRRQRVGE
jgi:EAL domain-containing protein (putative c-di-GMP-specific phosphodiesterase class I)